MECLNHYLTLDYFEWQLENETKNFHFMEIGWIVSFPRYGNKGKYCNYSVMFIDKKRGANQLGKCVKLSEVLDNPEFEQNYPHTVGYYKGSSGEGAEFRPEYLEIRRVSTVEEFWLFLNAVDI
jgi:hypothetical protein